MNFKRSVLKNFGVIAEKFWRKKNSDIKKISTLIIEKLKKKLAKFFEKQKGAGNGSKGVGFKGMKIGY